jgi:hypothetical protein
MAITLEDLAARLEKVEREKARAEQKAAAAEQKVAALEEEMRAQRAGVSCAPCWGSPWPRWARVRPWRRRRDGPRRTVSPRLLPMLPATSRAAIP